MVQSITVNFLPYSLHQSFTEMQVSPHERPKAIERSEPDVNLYIEKKFSFPRIVFPLHYLCYREDRMRLGIAKLEKLRFSFVSALAFRYLCTRYETEAYFFPIHLFVYGVSRHSTNACR